MQALSQLPGLPTKAPRSIIVGGAAGSSPSPAFIDSLNQYYSAPAVNQTLFCALGYIKGADESKIPGPCGGTDT